MRRAVLIAACLVAGVMSSEAAAQQRYTSRGAHGDGDMARLKEKVMQSWWDGLQKAAPQYTYRFFQLSCAVDAPVTAADRANGYVRMVRVGGTFARRLDTMPNQDFMDGKRYGLYGLKNGKWWLVTMADEDGADTTCRYRVYNPWGSHPHPIE